MKTQLSQAHFTTSGHPHRRQAGFTLVELLTVISIIVLLVAITIGILGYAQKASVEKKASGQMELLKTALGRYYDAYNEYPEPVDNTGEGAEGAKALYQALSGDGNDFLELASGGTASIGRAGSTSEPMMEGLDPKANKHGLVAKGSGGGYQLADPYGQPWHYRVYLKDDPGEPTNNKTYDLWSYGSDSDKENEAQWIKNW